MERKINTSLKRSQKKLSEINQKLDALKTQAQQLRETAVQKFNEESEQLQREFNKEFTEATTKLATEYNKSLQETLAPILKSVNKLELEKAQTEAILTFASTLLQQDEGKEEESSK